MKSHSEGIAMLAWSPDDTMLLSCGKEDNQEALVYSTQVWLAVGDVYCITVYCWSVWESVCVITFVMLTCICTVVASSPAFQRLHVFSCMRAVSKSW